MAIQRYRPYSLLDNLQREMSTLFQSPATETNFSEEDWTPAVDIQENAESYIIHAHLPGVKAVRDSKKIEEKDNYKRIERFSGSFMRRFTLPETADVDNINAASRDGVLELTIPKMPQLQPKRIEVNVQQ